MSGIKFNPEKLQRLNNPERLSDVPPEYIWSKLNLADPDTLIDIGTGTGLFSVQFLKLLEVGKRRVFACDISDVMLSWIEENLCLEYPGINPVKMQENAVPLDSGIADLVFMINLHHELENPVEMLKESFRLLKDGGKMLIVDWKKADMSHGPPVHLRYSPEDVEKELLLAGFSGIIRFDELPKHFMVIAEKNR